MISIIENNLCLRLSIESHNAVVCFKVLTAESCLESFENKTKQTKKNNNKKTVIRTVGKWHFLMEIDSKFMSNVYIACTSPFCCKSQNLERWELETLGKPVLFVFCICFVLFLCTSNSTDTPAVQSAV